MNTRTDVIDLNQMLYRHYNKWYRICALLPRNEAGMKNANALMAGDTNLSLLYADTHYIVLADKRDQGTPVIPKAST